MPRRPVATAPACAPACAPSQRRAALCALATFGFGALTGRAAGGHVAEVATGPPKRVPLRSAASYRASLLDYHSDGQRVRALVAVPRQRMPRAGWPLLIACHGFHPVPPRYGFSASGENARPGDYYRDVPHWYAEAGFVVVMPDYRGHNDSGGQADATDPTAPVGYARDVVALLDVLGTLSEADVRRVFLWGHSMGAEVVLRVLETVAISSGMPPGAVTRRARPRRTPHLLGASLWSCAGRPPDPVRIEVPVLLQHAAADPVAPSELSRALAASLAAHGRLRALDLLPGDAHFFQGAQAADAVRRDLGFFGERMSREAST